MYTIYIKIPLIESASITLILKSISKKPIRIELQKLQKAIKQDLIFDKADSNTKQIQHAERTNTISKTPRRQNDIFCSKR